MVARARLGHSLIAAPQQSRVWGVELEQPVLKHHRRRWAHDQQEALTARTSRAFHVLCGRISVGAYPHRTIRLIDRDNQQISRNIAMTKVTPSNGVLEQ
jgi:hypothetical protein